MKLKLENDDSKPVLVPALKADSIQIQNPVKSTWPGLINQLFFRDLMPSDKLLWNV